MISFDGQVWRLQNDSFTYSIALFGRQVAHLGMLPAGSAMALSPEAVRRRWELLPSEVYLNVNDEGLEYCHNARYLRPRASERAVYKEYYVQTHWDYAELVILLLDELSGAQIELHYRLYNRSPGLSRFTVVRNVGEEPLKLNHVSSFTMHNFPYQPKNEGVDELYLHSFPSQWDYEAEHRRDSFAQLGLYPSCCRKAFHVESNSAWSSGEYIPTFAVEDPASGLTWAVEIEHSFAWRFELSAGGLEGEHYYYMQGGCGDTRHAGWSVTLPPRGSFETPSATLAVAPGGLDEALNALHTHQFEVFLRQNDLARTLPVVYNEYISSGGNADEASVREQIPYAQNMGAEYFVIDSGWYAAKGTGDARSEWWLTVGDWEAPCERWPHGLAETARAIRRSGMIPGIWLEPECLGSLSKAFHDPGLPRMTAGGKPVEDDNRRFLSLADPRAREYLDGVVDRLVEMGFGYFKFDFNSDFFPGCDNAEGSPVHGGLLHVRAYAAWLRGLRRRYPDILIESCASGGMRMDYGLLSCADLVSISDQGDIGCLANLFFSVSRVVHPLQMGNWSLLYPQQNEEQLGLSLINSMLGRMTLGGEVTRLKPGQMERIQRATALYKGYRSQLAQNPRVYHLTPDLAQYVNNGILALEVSCRSGEHVLLAVWRLNTAETGVCLKLREIDRDAAYRVCEFPSGAEWTVPGSELADGLALTLPCENSGRLLWLQKQEKQAEPKRPGQEG